MSDEKMQDEYVTVEQAVIFFVETLIATQIAISRTALKPAQQRRLSHLLMRASKRGSKDTRLCSAALAAISASVRRHSKRWSRAG